MPSHKSKPTRVLDDVAKQVQRRKYSDAEEAAARESGYRSAEEADYALRARERKRENPDAKKPKTAPAAKPAQKRSGGIFDRINSALSGGKR